MEIKNRYHNGKIYTIRSHQTKDYYIGSTCLDLCKRLYKHRQNYRMFQEGKYHNVSSYEIIKYDDHYIELLESFKCENKNELERKEGELIRKYKNEIVNKIIVGRTQKEYYEDNINKINIYQKQYATDNKDKIKEKNKKYAIDNAETIKNYMKKYCEDNKDKIKIYYKTKIICDCGLEICLSSKFHHIKSKKHINLMKEL